MFTDFIGRLLGVENLQSINAVHVSLAAPWAQSAGAWLLFGCAALAILAVVFYSRWQPTSRKKLRMLLAISRRRAAGVAVSDSGRAGVEAGFHQPAAALAVGAVRRHREHGYSGRNARRRPGPAERSRGTDVIGKRGDFGNCAASGANAKAPDKAAADKPTPGTFVSSTARPSRHGICASVNHAASK